MKTNNLWILSGFLTMACLAQTAQANPLTICKLGQCAPAEMSLNAEQLYHYVDAFFEANIGQSITFCQANPMTKLCYQPAITLSAASSVIQSDIHLSKAVLLDAKKGTNFNTLSTILDMDIEANGTYPSCESVNSIVAVNATDKISITGYPFKCAFTNSSDTVLSLNFDVDYIDFDAAKIGTFYTLNARQAMTGEVSGYAVLTMPHPIVTNFELKNRVAEIVAPVAPIELVSVEQDEVEEPACDLCEKDEIQIQSEIAHRALAEANQAEMMVKEAMERALEKAQQAAKATEEVAEQKALAAELAKQEADTAAQMAEQARMRVSARVAALNGQPACDKQAVEGCSACANGLEQPTCQCKGEKAKSCGCMMDDCPYKKQSEIVSTEVVEISQDGNEQMMQEEVSQKVEKPKTTVTKTVVKSASVPKTTVTQTITRKRVVKSNGQIVEETEDTEIVSPDKIMSQEEIMSSVSEQKASKEVNTVPEITVKEEVQTPKIVIPTYKKEKTVLEKIAGFFWLDEPEN